MFNLFRRWKPFKPTYTNATIAVKIVWRKLKHYKWIAGVGIEPTENTGEFCVSVHLMEGVPFKHSKIPTQIGPVFVKCKFRTLPKAQ
jgi:hypothetical protein